MNTQQLDSKDLGTNTAQHTLSVTDTVDLTARNEWVYEQESSYSQHILKGIRLYQNLDLEIVPTVYVKDDGSCSCRLRKGCPTPGKHPAPKGWTTKYTSKNKKPEKIRWDDKQGVGIRTGRANALLVVDCDSEESYRRLLEMFPKARKTKTSKTSRGYQIYFRIPEGMILRGGTKVLDHIGIPDVDTRAEGNFVMAPPTRHPNGDYYEWLNDEKVAHASEELLDILKNDEKPEKSDTTKLEEKNREVAYRISSVLAGSKIEIGKRHDTFLSLATRYRSLGLKQAEISELLSSIPYDNSEEAPFTQGEISAAVEWAFDTIRVDDEQRRLLETLLDLYSYYSRKRWKGTGDYTDRDSIFALIQQGLIFGVDRVEGIDVPIAERTLATKIGTTRKTAKNSLIRLKRKGMIGDGKEVEGSHCKSYRLLMKPAGEEIYTELPQVEIKEREDSFYISLPGTPMYKSLHSLLSEFVDFRWGKGRLGKSNAAHLSILLSHSESNGNRVYKNKEVAQILSKHYGQEIKTEHLSRFFQKCVHNKILEKMDRGKYQIPEDICERVRAYKERSGEYLAAEEQSAVFEEERKQRRLREKLWNAGLHYAFSGENLRYKLLNENGEYSGQCPDKMRELLVRTLVNGEYVYKEAGAAWPQHSRNRLEAFMKETFHGGDEDEFQEAIMERFEESYE